MTKEDKKDKKDEDYVRPEVQAGCDNCKDDKD